MKNKYTTRYEYCTKQYDIQPSSFWKKGEIKIRIKTMIMIKTAIKLSDVYHQTNELITPNMIGQERIYARRSVCNGFIGLEANYAFAFN